MLNVTIGRNVGSLDFGRNTGQKKMSFGMSCTIITSTNCSTTYHRMGRNNCTAKHHGAKAKVTAIADYDGSGHGLYSVSMRYAMPCTVADIDFSCQDIVTNDDSLGTFYLTIASHKNITTRSERGTTMDVKATVQADTNLSLYFPGSKDRELRLSCLSLIGLMPTTQDDSSLRGIVRQNDTCPLSYLNAQRTLHHDGQTAGLMPREQLEVEFQRCQPIGAEEGIKHGDNGLAQR